MYIYVYVNISGTQYLLNEWMNSGVVGAGPMWVNPPVGEERMSALRSRWVGRTLGGFWFWLHHFWWPCVALADILPGKMGMISYHRLKIKWVTLWRSLHSASSSLSVLSTCEGPCAPQASHSERSGMKKEERGLDVEGPAGERAGLDSVAATQGVQSRQPG